jgi:hypothetical protein
MATNAVPSFRTIVHVLIANDAAESFWAVCGKRDARLLCVRVAQSVVHPRLRGVVLAWVCLRVSARCMAVRLGRRHLGNSGAQTLGRREAGNFKVAHYPAGLAANPPVVLCYLRLIGPTSVLIRAPVAGIRVGAGYRGRYALLLRCRAKPGPDGSSRGAPPRCRHPGAVHNGRRRRESGRDGGYRRGIEGSGARRGELTRSGRARRRRP